MNSAIRETTSTSPPSSSSAAVHSHQVRVGGRVAHVRFSHRFAGDFAPAEVDEERRSALGPLPWSWLHQVHGADVFVVGSPGEHAGKHGDGLVTAEPHCSLAVQVADCAPVALITSGAIGVAHAGWRGLEAGVIGAVVDALPRDAEAEITAVIGPHIGPECYEFGREDLERLVLRFGPSVVGETAAGRPALDVGAAVRSELGRAGVGEVLRLGGCTSCDEGLYFSHRSRGEPQRHALVSWMEESA